ncbi:SH3 domain-binding glutamic acid-rich-like protein 3 isoform 2 [Silurus asotus]|uniref:SH3 domain-binding glutamic acid-rich-like protein 3 isoform 2 n=1 Tax=Silurus asotus TaxID=30991 RepID=A0AAD5A945_SILAS|nr:SH3 domain-binding glutamic acid-rich-like protein 3 isoform 2 [Silurus asotus]
MSITVYYSSASGSREVKQQQAEILQFLDSKSIKYFTKDITQSTDVRDEMRQKVGNPKAMPPQVFNGSKYCGDYQAFFEAVEDGKPEKFFKL